MSRKPFAGVWTAVLLGSVIVLHAQSSVRSLEQTFKSPPDAARAMTRWWWFGPAVTKPELKRELEQMKEGGFGGFEIQPVYPLELDDAASGIRNLPYLSDEFLDDLRFVNGEARRLGLRTSLTLSSGWPYGGPHTPVTEAAARLRLVSMPVSAGSSSVTVPSLSNGEQMIAVFLADGNWDKVGAVASPTRLSLPAPGSARMALATTAEPATMLWFLSSRTGQQVKRAAVDADGFVLDHFSRPAVEHHLHTVADKLISAFGSHPPYSVFSDSLEVYGADWTPDFPEQFLRRRGYDLVPHLPTLFSNQPAQETPSEEASAVRHDWGVTLTELMDENYLQPIRAWAAAHGTLFRSQSYGQPAVSLSSNALVDLPEGEGPRWRQFSYTRWASSASHLYGRPITSSETWTWLHSPAFAATPLDMKAEADCFFLQGVNQLVGHGWPYSPPEAGEPGWRFYAAGAFNAHNPWWMVMPDVARYMQRVSWILRQGQPANDVAVYLPEDDAWAEFTPGKVSLSDLLPRWITPALTQSIEDAGYNFDYIDDAAIAARSIHYPVLILPDVDRISPATLARIVQYREQGGKLIAVGRLPAHAPGLKNNAEISAQVAAVAHALFDKKEAGSTRFIADVAQLAEALHPMTAPDILLATPTPAVGFLHRKLEDADIYFVANTAALPVHTRARFRATHPAAEWLDADTGEVRPVKLRTDGEVALDLEPYQSRILLLHGGQRVGTGSPTEVNETPENKSAESKKSETSGPEDRHVADLSRGWLVRFGTDEPFRQMPELNSWTDRTETVYYSGVATYRKKVELTQDGLKMGRLVLSFGKGTPVAEPDGSANHPGMRALLDAPIRDAAVVLVNGTRAGAVWHPPYEIDVTSLLKPGSNEIEVRVANTAINLLAGQSLPDYQLLWARYGKRFVPQDMENLHPLPSGLLGPIELISRSAE